MAEKMAGPKPLVPVGYDMFLDIFFMLNSERHFSDGVLGQIPATRILQYIDWLDMKNPKEALEIVSRVDIAYVNAISSSQKKKAQLIQGKHGR